jgi:hypothetical protein
LEKKPIITIWNKIDLIPKLKEQYKFLAAKSPQTIAMSAVSKEGVEGLAPALEQALAAQMEEVSLQLPYPCSHLLDNIHSLGFLRSVNYRDEHIEIEGKIPSFLRRQIQQLLEEGSNGKRVGADACAVDNEDEEDLNLGGIGQRKLDDWSWLDKAIAAAEQQEAEQGQSDEGEEDEDDEWNPAKLIRTDDY